MRSPGGRGLQVEGGHFVADVSLVVKWYIPEPGSAAAAALLTSDRRPLAPDLLAPEFANVMWKKARRLEITPEAAREIIGVFTSAPPVRLVPAAELLPAAVDLALTLDCPVYDCLYLALAVLRDCPLVTADRVFAGRLAGSGLEDFLALL